MGRSKRGTSSVLLFLFWAGVIPGAVQQSAVGQCDSDLSSLLSEPCPHCVSACEEGETTVPSPEFLDTPSTMAPAQPTEPAFAFTEQTGALATPDFAAQPSVAGYIDDAIIRSRIRIRYDYAKNASFPDRAEFWYPTVPEIGGRGPGQFGGLGGLDFQEIRTYVEWAGSPAWSVFGEVPVRFVNADGDGGTFFDPISQEPSDTVGGAGDITAGFRLGLLVSPEESLTTQFKVYMPTANPENGLGTGHTSLEAGLLYQRRWRDRWTIFGEIQDWVAINASRIETDPIVTPPDDRPLEGRLFGGNVLRYGMGLGFDIWDHGTRNRENRLVAVGEVVGWSVLDGFKSDLEATILDADGDTIVNGKFGLRYNLGRNTVYVGYGTAWTNERWYSDIFRLELGHYF